MQRMTLMEIYSLVRFPDDYNRQIWVRWKPKAERSIRPSHLSVVTKHVGPLCFFSQAIRTELDQKQGGWDMN